MIDVPALLRSLPEHLPQHLARQRWSGAHDRAVDSVALVWHEVVRAEEPVLVWTLARARFADGGSEDYQLFLGARAASPDPDFLHGKDRELVRADADVVVYDALIDPDLAIEVLHLVAPDVEVAVRRPLVLEHSNSSVVYDETTILKVFRKVQPGPNPDAEITRVLAERGYDHVLPPLAELRRGDTDLAVLREFLKGATEGWQLARASVRDLLAGGLSPEEAGGDFAPDADRLGAILAGLHLAMAEAWETTPAEPGRWAEDMRDDLRALQAGGSPVPAELNASAVEARFAALAELADGGQEMRIHGDLHLAQLVKTDAGWKVIDFEGEPARRRAERFTVSSPLRDLAGLLRSLHYAAATGLAEWGSDDDIRPALATAWEERNRAVLISSYLGAAGMDALLPASDEARALVLGAFELDKALYEVSYELGHRPDHVDIPMAGVARLLAP